MLMTNFDFFKITDCACNVEFHQYNTMEKVANYIELLLASSFNEERDKDF